MNDMVIYCERVGDGFWAEPLNAISSIAFVVLAGLALRGYRRLPPAPDKEHRWDLLLMVLVMTAVGVASFLWHTFSTDWAERADGIALLALMNIVLISFVYRIVGLGSFGVLLVLLAFQWLMVQGLNRFPAGMMNGYLFYLPALAVLWVAACYAMLTRGRQGLIFALAASVFSLSLWIRTNDLAVCPNLPTGTHFLWHLLSAATAYLLFIALARTVGRQVGDDHGLTRRVGSPP